MFPVLFALGPLVIRTFSVMLVLAYLVVAFLFWRKGKEEYYAEDQLFDGFLLATLAGFVGARLGYVLINFETVGWNILNWINFITVPGMSGLSGLIVAGVFLYRFAKEKKWDAFEVLDFWVLSVAAGLGIANIGAFLDGVGFGNATTLPWGVIFPGLIEPHHPAQLYYAAGYFALFWYLSWVEYRYRTFTWYRASKKAAETGFLVCMAIIFISVLTLIMSFFSQPSVILFDQNIDRIGSVISLGIGMVLLYLRSGRTLGWKKKKKRLFA